MDVEVKIQTLEAEMKILKNEVHEVLLEIQEQILLHYYPSLRPEELEPSDAVIQALDAMREKQQARQFAKEATELEEETEIPAWLNSMIPTSSEEREGSTLVDESELAQAEIPDWVRNLDPVSGKSASNGSSARDNVRKRARTPPAKEREDSESPPSVNMSRALYSLKHSRLRDDQQGEVDPEREADLAPAQVATAPQPPFLKEKVAGDDEEQTWRSFPNLVDWLHQSVEAIGARRTRKALDIYAEEGYLSPSVQEALERILALIA